MPPDEIVNLDAGNDPTARALAGVTASLEAAARGEPSAAPLELVLRGLRLVNSFRPSDWKGAAIATAVSADFYAAGARFWPALAEREVAARQLMQKAHITAGPSRGRR
jgi:hypothetical protein